MIRSTHGARTHSSACCSGCCPAYLHHHCQSLPSEEQGRVAGSKAEIWMPKRSWRACCTWGLRLVFYSTANTAISPYKHTVPLSTQQGHRVARRASGHRQGHGDHTAGETHEEGAAHRDVPALHPAHPGSCHLPAHLVPVHVQGQPCHPQQLAGLREALNNSFLLFPYKDQ